MLDSLYVLLNDTHSPNLLHLDYRPVLDHYIQKNNKEKVQQYVQLMYQEQQAFKEQKLKQSNDEKDRISQEIKVFLQNKEKASSVNASNFCILYSFIVCVKKFQQ
jgi:hypothetical protein